MLAKEGTTESTTGKLYGTDWESRWKIIMRLQLVQLGIVFTSSASPEIICTTSLSMKRKYGRENKGLKRLKLVKV